jgi:hypothetical protein
MLTLLTYITYMDVGNTDNAGAVISSCRQSFAGRGLSTSTLVKNQTGLTGLLRIYRIFHA